MIAASDIRRRLPAQPGLMALAKLSELVGVASGPERILAPPPRGSGLKGVPGDPGPPVVGYTFMSMRDPIGGALARYEQHGPVSWSRVFGIDVVSVFGGDAIEEVMMNRDRAYSQSGWEYFIGPFFHRGLMLLDFEEHLYHRRVMQHAFTRDRISNYFAGVAPVIQAGVRSWPHGRGFRLYPAIKRLSLDLATATFMGESMGPEAERVNKAFVASVRAGTAFLRFDVPGGRWAEGLKGRHILEEFFRRGLPAKRRSDSGDLFAALCHAESEDGERFTDDDVVNHMIFLMMAAHDTASITASMVAYQLARHPQWQARARAESMAVSAGATGLDVLEPLGTIDLVIKEALRMVPPVPGLVRKAIKDTSLLGHHIPADTMMLVSPWFNHNFEGFWSRPELFDPMRFAEPRREDKAHRMAWMPFGGGVHQCIGMHFGVLEVKALLHEMLRSFRWSIPDGYEMPLDTTSLPRPADGLPVRLEPIVGAD
ncbi:MAG: cytochrome P450 [Candidatus Dormiibacterota bacterium]